jgi:hypothetical protein
MQLYDKPAIAAELKALLRDGTLYDPRYKPSMNSDHLPMRLCAIASLGGDLAVCIAHRSEYKTRLHDMLPAVPVKH